MKRITPRKKIHFNNDKPDHIELILTQNLPLGTGLIKEEFSKLNKILFKIEVMLYFSSFSGRGTFWEEGGLNQNCLGPELPKGDLPKMIIISKSIVSNYCNCF